MTFQLRSAAATHDFADGLKRRKLWWFLALQDIRLRYSRSIIGPFWITLTMALYVLALGLVFGGLFGASLREVVPWITLGVILWTFLTATLNESTLVLMVNRGYFLQNPTPTTLYVWVVIARNGIISAHHLLVYLLVCVVFGIWPNANTLLVLPALALFLLFTFGLSTVLAAFTPRFRDIAPLVATIMTVGFFLTPVMWRPSDLVRHDFIATFNPFTHLLAIIREPLLGNAPSGLSWAVAGGSTLAALLLAYLTLLIARRRIGYWI